MEKLSSAWENHGKTLESMKECLEALEAATKYEVVEAKDVTIYAYDGLDEKRAYFYELKPEIVKTNLPEYVKHRRSVALSNVNKVLLTESISAGSLISMPVYGQEKMFYTADTGVRSLAEKAGVTGDAVTCPSVYRDALIKKNLPNKKYTAVYRFEKGENGVENRKIFGFLSEKYSPVPLTVITDVITAFENEGTLGVGELAMWETNHFFTQAVVEFPNAADDFKLAYGLPEAIIPAIRVSTSCTGDSSWRIELLYRMENSHSYSVKKEKKRNHIGQIKPDEVIADAKKELYTDITEFPEMMAKKMTQPIYDGDLSTEKGRKKNHAAVEAAIRRGMRKLHVEAAIGKKRMKDLETGMKLEIVDSEMYTEFDIASDFISICDRIANLPDAAKRKLEKAVSDAPWVTFGTITEGESLLVMPEEV